MATDSAHSLRRRTAVALLLALAVLSSCSGRVSRTRPESGSTAVDEQRSLRGRAPLTDPSREPVPFHRLPQLEDARVEELLQELEDGRVDPTRLRPPLLEYTAVYLAGVGAPSTYGARLRRLFTASMDSRDPEYVYNVALAAIRTGTPLEQVLQATEGSAASRPVVAAALLSALAVYVEAVEPARVDRVRAALAAIDDERRDHARNALEAFDSCAAWQRHLESINGTAERIAAIHLLCAAGFSPTEIAPYGVGIPRFEPYGIYTPTAEWARRKLLAESIVAPEAVAAAIDGLSFTAISEAPIEDAEAADREYRLFLAQFLTDEARGYLE